MRSAREACLFHPGKAAEFFARSGLSKYNSCQRSLCGRRPGSPEHPTVKILLGNLASKFDIIDVKLALRSFDTKERPRFPEAATLPERERENREKPYAITDSALHCSGQIRPGRAVAELNEVAGRPSTTLVRLGFVRC